MNSVRLPMRWMIAALSLTLTVCGWLAWNTVASYRFATKTKAEYLRLEQLRGVIIHLDEVLTMSASMAASTGDAKWEQRYRQYEPQLDEAIKEATQLASLESLDTNAKATDEANLKLVEMENRGFKLVSEGRLTEARAVLFSEAYAEQKAVYARGIGELTMELERHLNDDLSAAARRAGFALVFSLATMAAMAIAWLTAILRFQRWRAALGAAAGSTGGGASVLGRAPQSPQISGSEPRVAQWMEATAAAAAIVVAAGALVLLGWALDIGALKSVLPGLVTMKANAALAFVLGGIALWRQRRSAPAGRVARACAAAIAVIGALTLSEDIFGVNFGIDQLLFLDPAPLGTPHSGRMAPVTALNFTLLGLALFFLDYETRSRHLLAHWLTATAGVLSWLALLGYIYGLQGLYATEPFTSIALHTALAFLVLCVGVLSVRPGRGMMSILVARGAGGAALRRMLPAIIVIPAALGMFRLLGRNTGLYETESGTALLVVCFTTVLSGLAWWTATSLDITEREGERAEKALHESEAKFRSLAETTPAATFIHEGGRYRFVNTIFQQIMGYTRDELLAMDFWKIVHPDFRELVRERGLARSRGEAQQAEYEFKILTKSGKEHWVEVRATACEFEGRTAVLGTLFDITERKRAEEKLEARTLELTRANEELKRFNRATTGRELRVIQLKQEVNNLAAKLSQPRPYPLGFMDEAAEEFLRNRLKAGGQIS